jgi:hypothetical protein
MAVRLSNLVPSFSLHVPLKRALTKLAGRPVVTARDHWRRLRSHGSIERGPEHRWLEEGARLHDAALVRIRQPDRTGGAALPVADEKGRDPRLRYEFFLWRSLP